MAKNMGIVCRKGAYDIVMEAVRKCGGLRSVHYNKEEDEYLMMWQWWCDEEAQEVVDKIMCALEPTYDDGNEDTCFWAVMCGDDEEDRDWGNDSFLRGKIVVEKRVVPAYPQDYCMIRGVWGV